MSKITRRSALKAALGSVAASSFAGYPGRSYGAETIRVLDSGGAWQTAAKAAWYDPFEKETGVKVLVASGITNSAAQLKLLVQSGRNEVDVINLGVGSLIQAGREGLVEELDYSVIKTDGFLPQSTHKYALGTQRSGNLLIYNREKFSPDKAPQGIADFWDTAKFPGRRCLGNIPTNMLEFALVADGVPKDKIYPIDYERAFKKLDQIKAQSVWWTAYAQQTQFLIDKEVDLMLGSSARSLVAIEQGAPYELVWNDVMLNIEGWGVAKGTPNKDLSMKFLAFCAAPQRQAVFCERMAAGPVDVNAFRYLDPKRAKLLPTHPDIMKTAFFRDEEWYSENQAAAFNKWTEWRAKK